MMVGGSLSRTVTKKVHVVLRPAKSKARRQDKDQKYAIGDLNSGKERRGWERGGRNQVQHHRIPLVP